MPVSAPTIKPIPTAISPKVMTQRTMLVVAVQQEVDEVPYQS